MSKRETVPIAKADLIEVWSLLERLVVSLHKIGSHYATDAKDIPLPAERHLEMLETLNHYISPELWREMAHARRALDQYVPDDEAENLSAHVLQYWHAEQSERKDAAKK